MNLFIVLSNAPDPAGEAIEVVGYEVIEKAQLLGHSVSVQVIFRDPRGSAAAEQTESALRRIALPNVTIYPMLYVDDVLEPLRKGGIAGGLARLINGFSVRRLFPASGLGATVETRAREACADAIVSIWSWEALAATSCIKGIPKFVYYGNPDHLPARARFRNPKLFGIPTASVRDRLQLWIQQLRNERRKRVNIKMMNACEVTANNSILDAEFYRAHGHPHSMYLQNMWPSVKACSSSTSTDAAQSHPIKIIGSVGNLGATGNTFALSYLGREILPRLAARLKGRAFEIHLLGKGTPAASVAAVLVDARIKIRGWVDDIHEEFRSAAAFLVLTNVSPDFLVGNTRILLAWALGTCVIMHENSRLAMPEIEHDVNSLLGRTPEEIVELILIAADDKALRRRIGEGGVRTFETYYRSDVVVPKMLRLVGEMVDRTRVVQGLPA